MQSAKLENRDPFIRDMQTRRRLAALLNIHAGEERFIGLLFLLAFVLELAFVLIQSMAFGVFIAEYGPQSLPYSYIVIAVFASLSAVLYIKLSEQVSFSKALILNLAFLGTLTFFVWLGLKSNFYHAVSFILPLLYQIVANLGNLVIWQLAGRLFNLQQGKRLFPLLSSGTWLANILGGLVVLPLVNWMGAEDLLIPSALIIGLSTLILDRVTRSYPIQESRTLTPRRTTERAKRFSGFLQNRYVLLIIAFLSVWWIAFFFLDNIFADLVAVQFSNVNQLTAFRGQLLSLTGIVALFTSTFLTSRVIGRFGVQAGLLGEALPVTFTLGLLALSGSLGAAIAVPLALAALAKLLNVALGFSVSQAAYVMLYQPLPEGLRGRAQATAEGVFQPIACGLAGLGLLALTATFKLGYLGLAYIYTGIGVTLLIVIVLLSRGYVSALTQAITRRRFGETPSRVADPASVALLQVRLHDPHPGVALYALHQLDLLEPRVIARALLDLVGHPAPEVRRESFSRIETSRLRTALEAVNRQLRVETIPAVKESALRALGAIADAQSCYPLLEALKESDSHLLRGALIGLLKYQESSVAGQTLDRLRYSSSASDRILAAQVLGEADRTSFVQEHQTLLQDPDPAVRREAIQAVAASRLPFLYPLLLETCDSPETSHAASLALIDIGAEIFPQVKDAFLRPDTPRQRLLTLPKVMARIGGPLAQAPLYSKIDSWDGELRTQLLNALSQCGFRTKSQSEIYTPIKMEIQAIVWVCAAQADLGRHEKTSLLSAALRQFSAQTGDRVLLFLSFAFDKEAVLRVRDALLTVSASQLAYALEILETQLPTEWKPMILPLFEDLPPQERLQRLAGIFPQIPQTSEERLCTLIEDMQFTAWIRACAIYTAGELCVQACHERIQRASSDSDTLVRETAQWALAQFSTDTKGVRTSMLSTIEKVLILKAVNMFSQTPDNVLADVAELLEEMDVPEDETIFKEGDPGDSMYIIVDGRVRVHAEERLLNYLGESDVFGEMALLDPEPRLASVTTVEPTRLLRLEQASFYQLIAERPEVATGIIRGLTRLLRDRVRDLSRLDSRIKELERGFHGDETVAA